MYDSISQCSDKIDNISKIWNIQIYLECQK